MQKDTLIVSIVYFVTDIIKKHVDFLSNYHDQADIVILENPSENTNILKQYFLDLIKNKKISKYLLFNDNIGMNVFETYFNHNNIDQYKYIVVTDGDLVVQNPNWISELKQILTQCPNTYACGVKLLLDNLPINLYPDAKKWYPPPKRIENCCEVGETGLHLLMYEKETFKKYLTFLENPKITFMDTSMHLFCNNILKKIWRRTKVSKAYHLTWDLYFDKQNPYTIIKTTKSRNELWFHNKYSNYFETSLDNNLEIRTIEKQKYQKRIIKEEKNMRTVVNQSKQKTTSSNNLIRHPIENRKLNIGCGNTCFDGWFNIDLTSEKANMKLDVRKSLPFNNISLIYCEHFIEHLTKQEAHKFIKDCYRILKPNGVIRIATFDLDTLIDNCHSMNDKWRESCEVKRLGLDGCRTKAEFLNLAFHGWGHQYLYNNEELEILIKIGGFTNYRFCEINESEIEDLRNRESRFNSTLIIEGVK